MNPTKRADPAVDKEEPWFDEVRIIDADWVELSVTTAHGEAVHYEVPRRTTFSTIDRLRTSESTT